MKKTSTKTVGNTVRTSVRLDMSAWHKEQWKTEDKEINLKKN